MGFLDVLIRAAMARWPLFRRYVAWHCDNVWRCRALYGLAGTGVGLGIVALVWATTGERIGAAHLLCRVMGW